MPIDLASVAPPASGVYRIARRGAEPYAPPPWTFADPETGTFGNRFDDPGGDALATDARFRVVSAATTAIGAFGEVLAHLRPSLGIISQLSSRTRDTGHLTVDALGGVVDPGDPTARLVPMEWRTRRQLGRAVLDPTLRFADVADAASLAHLRNVPTLARLADDLGLGDVDLGAMTGPARPFTQACSRYIHDLAGASGPRFAGIRYVSRLGAGPAWECWALFDDRLRHLDQPAARPVIADDPALLAVARLYRLTIETDDGHLLRPWRN